MLAQLEQLFPDAAKFSAKSGSPPAYKAFGAAASGQEPRLLGYAYWTTELEPLERGFDGPIKMLVGMNTDGILTGVIVTEHHEPYGYFSVEPPEFAAQFKGKNVRDPFKVGADVDAVARATISDHELEPRDPQRVAADRARVSDARVAAFAMIFAARVRSIGGSLLRVLALSLLLASVSGAQPADDGAGHAGDAPGFEFRRRRRRRAHVPRSRRAARRSTSRCSQRSRRS